MSNIYDTKVDGEKLDYAWYNAVQNLLGAVNGVGNYPVTPAMKTIFKVGSVYYVKDGVTGLITPSGADANAVLQTVIDAAGECDHIILHPGTYEGLHLDITNPVRIFGVGKAVLQAKTGEYAITYGDGVTRLTDQSVLSHVWIEPDDALSKGGVYLNGPNTQILFDRVYFQDFKVDTEYAFRQNYSWDIILRDCVFLNVQHALLLEGTGYVKSYNTYFDASDVGGHGSTYNYGIRLTSGIAWLIQCTFETNPTTGVGIRVDYGYFNAHDCHWEGARNLYDVWVSQDRPGGMQHPNVIFGRQIRNLCLGLKRYPPTLFVNNRDRIVYSPVDATETLDGGTITRKAGGVRLLSSGVLGGTTKWNLEWWNYNKNPMYTVFRDSPSFETYFVVDDITNVEHWLAWGRDPTTQTNKHFGLHIVDGLLYVEAGDGTTGSQTTTAITLVANKRYYAKVYRRYANIMVILWDEDLTYVGDILATSHETNLPSGDLLTDDLFYAVVKTNENVAKQLDLTYPVLEWGGAL